MYQATILYIFYSKQCNLVLLVMHNACDTPIQRYLRFMLWARICNERKERELICLRKNKNAQLQSAGGMDQLAVTDWAKLN